jgi:hypothetical protein
MPEVVRLQMNEPQAPRRGRTALSRVRLFVAFFHAGFRHESVAMLTRWGLFIE